MPILSSRAAAAVKSFGFMVLTALKVVIDTFNRANTTDSLGSIKGQSWKIWRGGWRINSNKAEITTTASAYPLATLTFLEEDVVIGIDQPDPGMGMSFWVTDDGNWWGAVYEQTYTCQTCFACTQYTCLNYFCNNYNAINYSCNIFYNAFCNFSFYTAPNYTCNITGGQNPQYSCSITGGQNLKYSCSISFYTAPNYTCSINFYTSNKAPRYRCNITGGQNPRYTCNSFYTAPNYTCNLFYTAPNYFCEETGGRNLKYTCNAYGTSYVCNYESGGNCLQGFCTSSTCNAGFTYECNCVTGHKINILQSIANTVTEIATSNFNAAVASFKSILSGSNITVKAFSGSSYNSQIGSDWNAVNNADENTKDVNHGILGSQSDHAQGNTIEEFRVE